MHKFCFTVVTFTRLLRGIRKCQFKISFFKSNLFRFWIRFYFTTTKNVVKKKKIFVFSNSWLTWKVWYPEETESTHSFLCFTLMNLITLIKKNVNYSFACVKTNMHPRWDAYMFTSGVSVQRPGWAGVLLCCMDQTEAQLWAILHNWVNWVWGGVHFVVRLSWLGRWHLTPFHLYWLNTVKHTTRFSVFLSLF